MSKRTLAVSFLTAGLTAGILATAVGPAAAQGHPVGGEGSLFYVSGAVNVTGKAQTVFPFGNADDTVLYGDWYGNGIDLPMVRRQNVFMVPNETSPWITESVFAYGNPGDVVVVGDWNGDGVDSIAVRRGNQYLVKNDNRVSGKADAEFYFGEAGDKVHVGNWDGVVSTTATPGVDNNGDGDYDDPGTPEQAADIKPVDDPGYNANPADGGDYTQPGDRAPGTGVDNNKDGDFDDLYRAAVPADIPPTPAKGDTLMIQRGNHFFVKNSLTTGKADYDFYFGDNNDTVLVGNWATPPTKETAEESAKRAVSAAAGDQLAIRRGNIYHLSSEISKTALAGKNPKTGSVVAYGEVNDTVFVASLATPEVDAYGKAVDNDATTTGVQQVSITGDGFGVRRK